MTTAPRPCILLALPVIALAAGIGVYGVARGLAMVTIAALFGGPFAQVYTGAAITVAGVAWLGCVGVVGMRVLRPAAELSSRHS